MFVSGNRLNQILCSGFRGQRQALVALTLAKATEDLDEPHLTMERRMTVARALTLSFDHPVMEHALQGALSELHAQRSKPGAGLGSRLLTPARALLRPATTGRGPGP